MYTLNISLACAVRILRQTTNCNLAQYCLTSYNGHALWKLFGKGSDDLTSSNRSVIIIPPIYLQFTLDFSHFSQLLTCNKIKLIKFDIS